MNSNDVQHALSQRISEFQATLLRLRTDNSLVQEPERRDEIVRLTDMLTNTVARIQNLRLSWNALDSVAGGPKKMCRRCGNHLAKFESVFCDPCDYQADLEARAVKRV